ncbi:C-type lectin LmsL-like isoform X2 [Rhineura floridana]|uniref:C-type lectin LmsL-like isoform X2 n=1 Tax=Rhineura floridana TaxID=261503 RepID=UPI002AC85918|nr:C-type lectin LmsL-like isoform X2 [Rhineura floridana]
MGPAAYHVITLGFLSCLVASHSTEAAALIAGSHSPCPRDWLFYEGNCYGYFSDKKCWKEAEEECQKQGSHLASILSKQECCHLRRYLSKFLPDGDVWIGLHNPQKDPRSTSWQWSDGLVFDHTEWSPGQPNNYGEAGEFCVELWRSTGFKRWNDEVCRRKNSFVCKYEAQMNEEEIDCE